jgi:hypothetical protein
MAFEDSEVLTEDTGPRGMVELPGKGMEPALKRMIKVQLVPER